ncbi:MAG: hypothetical protein ACM30H_09630 [Clostridia bacterium]
MAQTDLPLLSVTRSPDGVWSVRERGPQRVAIAYFPRKWDAMRHAVKAAKAKPRARVVVLDGERVRLSHDYRGATGETDRVEVP